MIKTVTLETEESDGPFDSLRAEFDFLFKRAVNYIMTGYTSLVVIKIGMASVTVSAMTLREDAWDRFKVNYNRINSIPNKYPMTIGVCYGGLIALVLYVLGTHL